MVAITVLSETPATAIVPLSFALKVAGVPASKSSAKGAGIQVGTKVYTTAAGDLADLLRYAGRIGKLYPSDAEQALAVDRVLALIAAPVPDLRAINAEYITGKFLLGDQLTIADIALLGLEGTESYLAIHEAAMEVKNDPRVAKFLAE